MPLAEKPVFICQYSVTGKVKKRRKNSTFFETFLFSLRIISKGEPNQ